MPWETTTTTKQPKAKLKDLTKIERDSNTLCHWAKEALHIFIKDPSLNRNIGNFRISSVFNKLLKLHTQLELPHSSIPHPRGHLLHMVSQHNRQLTLHTFLISIYNRSVIPMFTTFKLQENWIFRSPPSKNTWENSFHMSQGVIFSRKYLSFKFWSSHQFINQGWRRN